MGLGIKASAELRIREYENTRKDEGCGKPHKIREIRVFAPSRIRVFEKGQAMSKVQTGGVESTKLRSYIDRIERLEEDKAGVASDIKDVFAEAKSNGFDVKAMRSILKLRKMKANERTEAEYMLDLYKRALGMDEGYDADAEAA